MTDIPVGSFWQRKRGGSGHHGDIVKVVKVTVNNVYYQDRPPQVYQKPPQLFVGMFEPFVKTQARDGLPLCKSCHDFPVREFGQKYCQYCVKDVNWLTRTITKTEVVPEPVFIYHEEPSRSSEETQPGMKQTDVKDEVFHWRVFGGRWVFKEEEWEVATSAEDLLSVQAEVDSVAPGLKVRRVEQLNGHANGR